MPRAAFPTLWSVSCLPTQPPASHPQATSSSAHPGSYWQALLGTVLQTVLPLVTQAAAGATMGQMLSTKGQRRL